MALNIYSIRYTLYTMQVHPDRSSLLESSRWSRRLAGKGSEGCVQSGAEQDLLSAGTSFFTTCMLGNFEFITNIIILAVVVIIVVEVYILNTHTPYQI